MKYLSWRTVALIFVASGILLLGSIPADAQCSMCRAAVSGANNSKFIQNLNIGVLVLLVPPVTIFCSIFVVLRRNRGESASELDEPKS
jgi:hypothetical protein